MVGGDQQLEQIRRLSNKELFEKIERLKRSLTTIQLLDGGEKFKLSIKRHEDELERKHLLQLQKDDEKCKKQPQFQDLSLSDCLLLLLHLLIFLFRVEGGDEELLVFTVVIWYMKVKEGNPEGMKQCLRWLSEHTPSSLANYGSEFNKSFRKKLEKQVIKMKDSTTGDAFRTELSTLNRSDCKKMESSGRLSSIERHNGGLSSRQIPFQCPSSLSIKVNKQTLSHCDQKGRCSTSPPNHSKDELATRSAKKRKSYQVQPSNGLRSSNTVVVVDEDEHGILETTQQVEEDECLKEARIYYPSRDDPGSAEILYSDLECLAPEAYVSSTKMNFYIRYMQQHGYLMSKQADGYHFFNTYFYQKLKEAVRKKNDNKTSFAKVRRWWKGVKLFEKAYIFLPIHEGLHWSLVIICIPDKEAGRGAILLHLDSLDLHPSKLIFENIRRLLIGEWNFLKKEESHMDYPIPKKIWENLPRRIDEKRIEVPQQKNDYDWVVCSFLH